MKLLADLFLTFMRIGGLTFGGGYAMLPMIQREVVDGKKWATEEEIMNYYAIGQCTPGIIAVNTATFIGHKMVGIAGAIVATLGLIFPSWIIITIIAMFIRNFAQYEVVQHALVGITCCVFALVLDAVIKLGKKALNGVFSFVVATIVFALALFTDISTFFLVIGAGIVGGVGLPIIGKLSNASKENGGTK